MIGDISEAPLGRLLPNEQYKISSKRMSRVALVLGRHLLVTFEDVNAARIANSVARASYEERRAKHPLAEPPMYSTTGKLVGEYALFTATRRSSLLVRSLMHLAPVDSNVEDIVTIGRSPDLTYKLPLAEAPKCVAAYCGIETTRQISERHLTVTAALDGVIVEDLGSQTGTLVIPYERVGDWELAVQVY